MRDLGLATSISLLLLAACGTGTSDASNDGGLDASPLVPPTGAGACEPPKSYRGEAWSAADALFHRDPRWLGGDAAYSIELAPGRILWLFGDSFIATSPNNVRTESTLVRNSIAIQNGADPATSAIAFTWREGDPPRSFFGEEGARWFWPLHGARVGGELVLFMNEIEKAENALGFETVGTRMLRVRNPDDDPSNWTWSTHALPADGRTYGTSVVASEGFLYSLTTRKTVGFDVLLERWPFGELDRGRQSWTREGFVPLGEAARLWTGGSAEFVTGARCGEWLTIESKGFGATDLVIRRAKDLVGPWSSPDVVFRPPESDGPEPFVYAGKFHPTLTGSDLVATYVASSFDFAELLRDESLYYPRFVKLATEP